MSTIRVDNFAPSAGGTAFGIDGIAKAAWKYDQTTPAVDAGENVSSITDSSTGVYAINLTNDMADTDYRTLLTTVSVDSGSAPSTIAIEGAGTSGPADNYAAGSIGCIVQASNGNNQDMDHTSGAVYGDLA